MTCFSQFQSDWPESKIRRRHGKAIQSSADRAYHEPTPRRATATFDPMSGFAPRLLLLALLAVAAAGCVTSRAPEATISRGVAEQVVARAARQVRRCYRPPRIPSQARQITTRLRVRFQENGTLIGLPELVAQDGVTPANQAYAGAMAQAAIAAVIRCAPITLLPELRTGPWDFQLTFSPQAVA